PDSGHRVTRHQVIWLDSEHRVIWQGSGLRVNWGMTAGTGAETLNRLAGQRASGHQASGHLARPRAQRHLARQWAPSQLVWTAGTGSDIGSSDWTAGIGSPGIRSFGSTAGTASSGKAVVSDVNRHDSGHRVIRYRIVWLDSGHRVIRHQVIWLASVGTASSGKAVGTES
ncbi:unnamed protein product, partial [Staurois parvus]